MNVLDLRTVLFSYVITSGICTIVIGSLWYQNRKRSPELGYWLADFVMQFLAILLIALRGVAPDAVSILLGVPLILGGSLLLFIGLERYVGLPSSQRRNTILLIAFISIHAYFTLIQPSLPARNINQSIGLLVLLSQSAWLLLQRVNAETRPITRMTGVAFVAFCLASAVRIFVDVSTPSDNDLLKSGLYDTLVVLLYQMLFIALAFSLSLMVSRRLYAALEQDILVRKQAEEKMRYQSALLESVSDAIVASDAQFHLTAWNAAAESMYGWKGEQILGQIGTQLIQTRYPDADQTHMLENMARVGQYRGEATQVRKDGSRFPVEISSRVLRDDNGQITGYVSVNRDITERKRAEQALVESELKYRTLFKSMSQGFYLSQILYDQNGAPCDYRYIDLNSAFEKIIGANREQIIGKTYNELVPSDPESGWLDCFKRVAATGIPENYTFASNVYNSYFEVYAFKPEQDKFAALVRDITERKRADEALRKSETQLRLLTDNMTSDIISLTDAQMNTLYVSPSLEGVLGYAPQEVIGKPAIGLIHPDDLPKLLQVVTDARRDGVSSLRVEQRSRHKNGNYIWAESAIQFLNNEHGQSAGAIINSRDITERKRAEEEIRKFAAELEQRVAERTAQLQEANKELEAFAYSVSHDLRTPLRAIDGFSRILTEDFAPALGEEGQRVCAVISNNATRMGQLIDEILAFSRLSRTELKTSTIDMTQLVTTVYHELTAPDDRTRIDLQIDELPAAVGDHALIHQVWTNLLANAIKFSSKRDRALIQVSAQSSDTGIIYGVRDNGAGFSMEYADKLFGVFQRLHKEKEFPGTGVGLAIVQRIIQRHGGRIWAEGTVDQGAAFFFALPVKQAA
jgi:PAS domain S-box-containing protein